MTTTVAPTLNARLASACECAYGINAETGLYVAPHIYDPAVNWRGTPTAVSATSSSHPKGPRINACLVGLNQDGILLAFRGTLPPAWTVASLEDWWQDIVDSAPIAAPPLPGKVHEGFWHALETLWDGVRSQVRLLVEQNPEAALYVTGHSKGGPLASLAAARLLLEDQIKATEVVTFASPHPGNTAFVRGYPAELPVTRFENYLDLVPFVPPTEAFFNLFSRLEETRIAEEFCRVFPGLCRSLEKAAQWDYASLGALGYVTSSGTVVGQGDPEAHPERRLSQILLVLFGLAGEFRDELHRLEALVGHEKAEVSTSGLSRIGAAHCVGCRSETSTDDCAGGYMTGAGGDPICPPAAG